MTEPMMSETGRKLKGLAGALSFAALHEDYQPDEDELLGISHILQDISKTIEADEKYHQERLESLRETLRDRGVDQPSE